MNMTRGVFNGISTSCATAKDSILAWW